jgi:hypothetical protein
MLLTDAVFSACKREIEIGGDFLQKMQHTDQYNKVL